MPTCFYVNNNLLNMNYIELKRTLALYAMYLFLPLINFLCICNFISSLIQDIIDGTTELFSSGMISKLKSKISPFLDNNSNQSEIAEIYNMFSVLKSFFKF